MKKILSITASAISLSMLATSAFCATPAAGNVNGKALFDQHCKSCHPNGGNIMNQKKTLSKQVMAHNGVKTENDIVAKMRNPGPGMTHFDAKAVPDKDAKAIAHYIMTTFK